MLPRSGGPPGTLDRSTLDAINERLADWLALVTGEPVDWTRHGAGFWAACPFGQHSRKKMEGTVKGGVWVARCRACDIGGDLIKLTQRFYSLPFREAVERVFQELGVSLPDAANLPKTRDDRRRGEDFEAAERAAKRKTWPTFVESPSLGCQNLGKLRGIPVDGIRAAHSWNVLRFTHWRERPCWVLRSHDGTCAEARRMDGFPFWDGGPKAMALPGSQKRHCLLGEHLLAREPDPCFLVEGGPDWLCACWLAAFAMTRPDSPVWVPLGFLGAECSFSPAQLDRLRGRLVRLFVHGDEAGEQAAERWTDALTGNDCPVELVRVRDFAQVLPNGKPVKDLNDALLAPSTANLEPFAVEAVTL